MAKRCKKAFRALFANLLFPPDTLYIYVDLRMVTCPIVQQTAYIHYTLRTSMQSRYHILFCSSSDESYRMILVLLLLYRISVLL